MAKRIPRSQADDPMIGDSTQKGRAGRTRTGAGAPNTLEPANLDTQAARPAANDLPALDKSMSDRRPTPMASQPSQDDIRHRAYQRYLERGGGHGLDFEDWLEAERELNARKH